MKKKVAFIYFDYLGHIFHFIGVAADLSKNKNIRVDILTYSSNYKYLKHLIELLNADNISPIEETHQKFKQIQNEFFENTFDISNEISSHKRVANEINQFIN